MVEAEKDNGIRIQVFNVGENLDGWATLKADAWKLLVGDANPDAPDYNPDGMVVSFKLPAPFDTVLLDVIIPWTAVDDIRDLPSIEITDLFNALDWTQDECYCEPGCPCRCCIVEEEDKYEC